MDRLRHKLTYANVMATVAVFIALGGASYAAVNLPKNSVGSRQIKTGAVTGTKLKNGAVTRAKIAAGAVGGAQLNLSSIGTVPSATHAASADSATDARTLGGQSAAQIAVAATIKCPTATLAAGGMCFDATQRPPANFRVALQECAARGMSLPTLGEAATLLIGKGLIERDWAGSAFVDESTLEATNVSTETVGHEFVFGTAPYANQIAYRCAIPPAN
jgi:hypothetical protein